MLFSFQNRYAEEPRVGDRTNRSGGNPVLISKQKQALVYLIRRSIGNQWGVIFSAAVHYVGVSETFR